MAVIATSGNIYFPAAPTDSVGEGLLSVLLDSANESIAQVLQLPRTATISKVGFRTMAVNTGAELDIRLETVADTGHPSGTLYQTSSNVIQSVLDANDNIYFTVTLGSGTVISAGSIFAVRIQMSATSAGSLNLAIGPDGYVLSSFPYNDQFLANAWTKSVVPLICGLEDSNGEYLSGVNLWPIQNVSSLIVTTASTPDEVGAVFSLPYPCTAIGGWGSTESDSPVTFTLYDSDTTTVLRKAFLSSNNTVSTSTQELHIFYFSSSVNFVAGNSYRLTIVPDPSPVGASLGAFVGSSVAVMSAFGNYPRHILTFRTNSGAWTDDARQFPTLGLILNGFDDAAQTGGGTTAAGVWGF